MTEAILLYQIIIIIFLIILSAFFSSSETAITSISEDVLQKKVEENDYSSIRTQKLLKKKELVISGILLGNNLVNILSSAVATNLFIKAFGTVGILYSTITMTTIIFIFAEVLPKIYAIRKAETLLVFYTPYLNVVLAILYPINNIIHKVIHYLVKGNNHNKHSFNLDRIRGAILLADKEGNMLKDDKLMLESILDLKDREVNEVMIHRKDIFSLNIGLPEKELFEKVKETNFSRLPVWDKNPENIIGVILVKDLLKIILRFKKFNIKQILQKPLFIPETTNLFNQLNSFKEKKKHMAFVVDEYGVLQGLVTLEDILEEIVGQIEDEFDVSTSSQSDVKGNIFVRGNVSIRDLNRIYNLNFSENTASTIGGLIINYAKRIPEIGEIFVIDNIMLTVSSRSKTRITKVQIQKT
ncbi:CNNM domain-containing protein [Alphaproteobacteria bacterium]|nr:CNNM domain-containing protein [Alphaproteobacteria bacterium]